MNAANTSVAPVDAPTKPHLRGWLHAGMAPVALVLGIVLVALFGEPWTAWLLAPVLGVSLGTVYTVDRLFMLALTPEELRGELFGICDPSRWNPVSGPTLPPVADQA